MLQQNDLDTKQLITDLTNLLTRGVDRIVGNNIKKREMLERKQQYVTETLTQLLLKLEEDEDNGFGFDDISAITSKTLKNDNIEEYHSNSASSSFNDLILNSNEVREQYLSNYVIYKELEASLLKDDTYAYSGKYLSVHGPNSRYLHETYESAWNHENRHIATFIGMIGNETRETAYGKELLEKQNQSLVNDCFKEDIVSDVKVVNNEQEVVNNEQEVVKVVNNEEEVVKDVLQIQTDLNDVFEEEEKQEPIEQEEMIMEEEEKDLKEDEVKDGEEEELFEIQIGVTTYATDNEINGTIYALVDDGDVGDKVGYFKDGKAFFPMNK
jgi:hypothetical protein